MFIAERNIFTLNQVKYLFVVMFSCLKMDLHKQFPASNRKKYFLFMKNKQRFNETTNLG